MNFNCVVLDVALVDIGDFVLFGPAVQAYTATHPLRAYPSRKQPRAGTHRGPGQGARPAAW